MNKYDLTKKIREGVYGKVYEAQKQDTKDKYAIKIIHLENKFIDKNILREIVLIKPINYKYIMNYIEIHWIRNSIYIVEPLGTCDLKDLYTKYKLDKKEKYNITYQIALALGCLKDNGILHRDIKPRNVIYFADDKSIKLADFGLCRISPTSEQDCLTEDMMTLWYRPPEIILGGRYDFYSDLWSFGCLIYELFFHKPLFNGLDEKQMMSLIYNKLGKINNWDNVTSYPRWEELKQDEKYEIKEVDFKMGSKKIDKIMKNIFIYNPELRIDIYDVIKIFNDKYISSDFSHEKRLTKIQKYPTCGNINDDKRNQIFKYILGLKANDNVKALTFYILDSINKYEIEYANCCYFLSSTLLITDYTPEVLKELEEFMNCQKIEMEILSKLDFNIYTSTAIDFLNLYIKDNDKDLIKDLVFKTYLDKTCFKNSPKDIVLSCIKEFYAQNLVVQSLISK